MIKTENYKDWLKSLKAGDEVACDVSKYNTYYCIFELVRRTPKKMFFKNKTYESEKEMMFSDEGYFYDNSTGTRIHIVCLTDEIRNIILKRKMLRIIEQVNFESIDTLKLKEILNLCGKTI